MTDELKPSPEAVLTKLTDDHGYTVYHDPEDDELTITQTRFYEVQYGGLDFAVSVSELNEPNQWNNAAMDGFCAHFEAALVIDRALRPIEIDPTYPGRYLTPGMGEALDALTHPATMPGDMVEGYLPMETAPKDGTLLDLLVDYTDGDHPLEDDQVAGTIGFNQLENTGEDSWQFVGWCWTHDHFVDGRGKVIGWRPRITAVQPAIQAAVDALAGFVRSIEGWPDEAFPAVITTEWEQTASAYDITLEEAHRARTALATLRTVTEQGEG